MASRKILRFLLLSAAIIIGSSHGKVDSDLRKKLATQGRRADVLVSFVGSNSEVIQQIQSTRFQNRKTKVDTLNAGLQELTKATQKPIIKHLKNFGIPSESFWSSNQLVVRNVNLFHVESIDAFPAVSRIQKLPIVQLSPVSTTNAAETQQANSSAAWGIKKIQADQAWDAFGTMGEGVVVANIDTGVRGTHEALVDNFRADHGWFDPYGNKTAPYDNNGHGTHTMGTICGKGIGVAPGAQWIACKGCGDSSCDAGGLLTCGQWMLQPTNPDGSDPNSSLIPDVVSNSWGSNIGNDNWYNATIDAWKAAGILHAFAIGNSGPSCGTGGSPGDQPTTFSVGSTDINDRLSIFSSKGPAGTTRQLIKPDIAAPGSNVYSAWNSSDTTYNTISGTSMATPHVAGTIALMVAAKRMAASDGNSGALSFTDAVNAIEKSADTQNLTVAFPNYRCDGSFFGQMKYPNNQFGYGRVNAFKSVNATINGIPKHHRNNEFFDAIASYFYQYY